MKYSYLITVLLLILNMNSVARWALADSKRAAQLPQRVSVEGTTLTLNGLGLREFSFFKVDVYVAGLYLEKKCQDSEEIINSPGAKQLILHFVRNVQAEDIHGACDQGLRQNRVPIQPSDKRFSALKSYIPDVGDKDRIVLTFVNETVQVSVRGAKKGVIKGADFSKALLTVWLGDRTAYPGLRRGLLGLK